MSTANTVYVGEPVHLTWAPWTAQEIADRQIVRVELECDGTALPDVPPPLPIPGDVYTCQIPPALLTIGLHAIRGRVCRAATCGAWVDLAIEVTPIAPGVVRDLTVVVGSKPLDLDVSKSLAYAYAELVGAKRPKDAQLIALGQKYLERFPDGVLTRGRLLALFDAEFLRLSR